MFHEWADLDGSTYNGSINRVDNYNVFASRRSMPIATYLSVSSVRNAIDVYARYVFPIADLLKPNSNGNGRAKGEMVNAGRGDCERNVAEILLKHPYVDIEKVTHESLSVYLHDNMSIGDEFHLLSLYPLDVFLLLQADLKYNFPHPMVDEWPFHRVVFKRVIAHVITCIDKIIFKVVKSNVDSRNLCGIIMGYMMHENISDQFVCGHNNAVLNGDEFSITSITTDLIAGKLLGTAFHASHANREIYNTDPDDPNEKDRYMTQRYYSNGDRVIGKITRDKVTGQDQEEIEMTEIGGSTEVLVEKGERRRKGKKRGKKDKYAWRRNPIAMPGLNVLVHSYELVTDTFPF